MPFDQLKRSDFITLIGGGVSVCLCVSAAAQEGYYGVDHGKWHRDFYSKLKRNDGQGPAAGRLTVVRAPTCSATTYRLLPR
jgi:hypothetical protein